VAAVLALLGGALGIVTLLQAERLTPGQEAAQAIVRGMAPTMGDDPAAMEDERITGSANEAGYRWAERWSIDDASRCPRYSDAFRAGCAAYVADEAGR